MQVSIRYKEGMVKPKGDMKQSSRSEVGLATAEVMALINQEQPEAVEDRDIDDLLCWTDALNFDEWEVAMAIVWVVTFFM